MRVRAVTVKFKNIWHQRERRHVLGLLLLMWVASPVSRDIFFGNFAHRLHRVILSCRPILSYGIKQSVGGPLRPIILSTTCAHSIGAVAGGVSDDTVGCTDWCSVVSVVWSNSLLRLASKNPSIETEFSIPFLSKVFVCDLTGVTLTGTFFLGCSFFSIGWGSSSASFNVCPAATSTETYLPKIYSG